MNELCEGSFAFRHTESLSSSNGHKSGVSVRKNKKKSANQKCRLSGGDATGEQRCQAPRLCLCHTSARKVEKNQTIKTHFCFNDLSTEDNNHTRLGTVLMFEISFLVSFVGQ